MMEKTTSLIALILLTTVSCTKSTLNKVGGENSQKAGLRENMPTKMGGDSGNLKGLFVMTFGTKSHLNFFRGIIEALANNGHQITVVTPFESKIENIEEILLEKNFYEALTRNMFQVSFLDIIRVIHESIPEICLSAFTDPGVTNALKQRYDYVLLSMYFADCFLGYVHENKLPFGYVTPNLLMMPQSDRFGAIEYPSVSPHKMLNLVYPLSFWGRVLSSVGGLFISSAFEYIEKRSEVVSREMKIWSPEIPPLEILQKNASLAIINSVRAVENPVKIVPPTIIYAGGIHIHQRRPLPHDMEMWVNGAGEEGFILFALGSAVNPNDIKSEDLDTIISVLGALDLRVIWKWDPAQEIDNLPSNIKLFPWLPQQDILAHPNIKLFITHGGLLSITEAQYFGVPVLGMPVYGDQMNNIAEVCSIGWGVQVSWKNLTKENFHSALQSGLTDESLKETVRKRSELMRDWPMTPAQEVVYWVEYMVRHDGAPHLKSPFVHMSWIEIYNVDVWMLILSFVLVSLYILYLFGKLLAKLTVGKFIKLKRD